MASTSDRGKSASRRAEMPVSNEPRETNSIIFEWPLRGLKQMFDSSKMDAKSKVIKSAPFGGGRWTVLFYAQSGHEQFCSLYLNAEPLAHERVHPLLNSTSSSVSDVAVRGGGGSSGEGGHSSNGKVKNDHSLEEKWQRKGLFRFTFNIQTIEERTILGTKEAHDHAFSHKTSNWGWAQFSKRDHVYYKNPDVVREDGFLITVTITSSPEKPKMAEPISHIVPPVLVQAMGSLLDDPEHSDVVFLLHPSRRRAKAGKGEVSKVYAIRKILAARSDYFRLMFEGGFQEAEVEESSDDEESARQSQSSRSNAPAHPSRSHHSAARAFDSNYYNSSAGDAGQAYDDNGLDGDSSPDDDDDTQEAFFEDSDEDLDDDDLYGGDSPFSTHAQTPADSSQRDYLDSGNNSPNEDSAAGPYNADYSDDEAEMRPEQSVGRRSLRLQGEEQISAGVSRTLSSELLNAQTQQLPGNSSTPSLIDIKQATNESLKTFASKHHSDTQREAVSPTSKRASVLNGEVTASEVSENQTNRRTASSTMLRDRRRRRKVNVLDSAYPTFKALLFFLYTDTVEFAPLTSSFLPADVNSSDEAGSRNAAAASLGLFGNSGNGAIAGSTSTSTVTASSGRRGGRQAMGSISREMAKAHRKRKQVIEAYCERNPDKPSPCSAKAMYRLADKLDIPDLKRRAQEHIQMSLTEQNIVWEVFSGFNTQYPDIRKMETDFLLKHWPQVKRSNAMKSIFLRSSAHPGLAEVWPHLLEYLEYRQPDVDEQELYP